MKKDNLSKRSNSYLYLLLLMVSDIWLTLYLLFFSRFIQVFRTAGWIKRFFSPFFMEQYIWGDFYGPIQNSATLAPYVPKYGNSPPLLALISYFFAKLQENGIGWEMVYLFLWLCFSFFIFYSIRQSAVNYNVKKSHGLMTALLTLVSFPFIYCFDRGNYVFLVAGLVAAAYLAHQKDHSYFSAVLIGIAAALKLYPAVFGVMFLAKKEWKQAVVCAFTGVVISVIPLFFFEGGFVENLKLFIQKTLSYAEAGNGKLEWLYDDKNSFYQLLLVPKMLGKHPITSVSELSDYLASFRIIVTCFFATIVLISIWLKDDATRFLLLSATLLGYPIESGVYNQVLVLFPLANWCFAHKQKGNKAVVLAGVGLITMKNFISISTAYKITPQAILNPVFELVIILMLLYSEKDTLLHLRIKNLL